MQRNVLPLIAIFLCVTAAWFILGASIGERTRQAGDGLAPKVEAAWGAPQQQNAPEATSGTDKSFLTLPVERSRIRVALDLEQRQKGLLWFPTYRVGFHGDYRFRNNTPSTDVTIKFVFPAPDAVYDDLVLKVDGQPLPLAMNAGSVVANLQRAPGAAIDFEVGYRSQGVRTWNYNFGAGVAQVRDFILEMRTNFAAIDFPSGTISPAAKQRAGRGWLLTWRYANVVTGYGIGMVMPEKLQPGPLAGRISYFAPVSLLFFFFFIFLITALKRIELHPMHYFFLATSFFAFHLLLAYLVDHISIHLAFVICSAVSIFLVVSYLRIVVDARFAWREAALSQLVYLVLFSYAFFFKGFTGLAVTIGAIASLFVAMQATARIDWGTAEAAATSSSSPRL